MFTEEAGHEVKGLLAFGQIQVIPKGVGQAVEDDQLGVDPGAQQGAIESTVPLSSTSRVLVTSSVGGKPCRSANIGERTGSRGLVEPT